MAHLDRTYESFETFLNGASGIWTVELDPLNSSGASGTAILAMGEGEGTPYLNVAIVASGMTANQVHAQHVHGLFDEDGNPIDSVTPTLQDDADLDGLVEVLEGVGRYGDVLLPLVSGGDMPMAGPDGVLAFMQSYDLTDASNFFSPVTGTDYDADDIMPLDLREIVLHGVDVPDGIGEGTDGEVDGGENGYTGILPAAAGEIEEATLEEALALLAGQERLAGQTIYLTRGDDDFDAGLGDDEVYGLAGNDEISGGTGDDKLFGNDGDDVIKANDGDDLVFGGDGDDVVFAGAGDDFVKGKTGDDKIFGVDGDDKLQGNDGDDVVNGGDGDDVIFAGEGADTVDGGTGNDRVFGVSGDDMIDGGAGDDRLSGGSGDDTVLGGDGDDRLDGQDGEDLLVGGAGADAIYGGDGDDIIGGGGGDDLIVGGAGRDEFHFDAGTGTDLISDFVQGEDVISLLDRGAVDFPNSAETDGIRGDSDLSPDDFDFVDSVADLDAGNESQVVYSDGGMADAMAGTGAAVKAYLAATDGTDTGLYYDDDWSTVEGRELIAVLDDFSAGMTVNDFDVY